MTEITFNSVEPNAQFKAEIADRGFSLVAWIPPKRARKNARYPTSKYGHIIIEMPLDLAVDMTEIADKTGQDMVSHAWSSHAATFIPK